MWEWALRVSTRSYAGRAHRELAYQLRPAVTTIYHFSILWPLPVGRAALHQWVHETHERGLIGYYGDPSMVADALPFDGDERAGWILDARVGTTRVEAFGLVRIEDRGTDPQAVFAGEIAFRLTGSGVVSPGMLKLCKNIAEWWESLGGQRVIRMGPQDRTLTSEDIAAAYIAFYEALDKRPTQQEVATELGCDVRTVRRVSRDYGDTWPGLAARIRR